MNNLNCPVCSADDARNYLSVKDYTVSGEIFELVKCNSCDFVFTANPPSENEIGRYYQSASYISHTDSKKGFLDKVYQLVRSFTLVQKRRLIERLVKKKEGNMLDYGCGTGAFIQEMHSHGWEVTGIEPDPGARMKASQLTGEKIKDTGELQALSADSYDIVTLWHVLEHVHELNRTIQKFREIIKPGGVLLIAVPNLSSYDAMHYAQYWAAYDVPRHLYHFTPRSIDLLLTRYGFKKIEVKPMWFDSFYVSLLSEKYKKGKMDVLSAIWTGFLSNLKSISRPGTCSSQVYLYRKH